MIIHRDGKTFVEVGQNKDCPCNLDRMHKWCTLLSDHLGIVKHKDCPSLKGE